MSYFGLDVYLESVEKEAEKYSNIITHIYAHMMKYQYQPDKQSKSWIMSIFNHRKNVWEHMTKQNIITRIKQGNDKIIKNAIIEASSDTGINMNKVIKNYSIYNYDFIFGKENLENFARTYFSGKGDLTKEELEYTINRNKIYP